MRIRMQKLVVASAGVLTTEEGRPFTGVAYEVKEDGQIPAVWNVAHGVLAGIHQDEFAGKRRFLKDKIEYRELGDDVEAYALGAPFHGVICEFLPSGVLFEEEEYSESCGPKSTTAWYPNGVPKWYQASDFELAWHPDGSLSGHREAGFSVSLPGDHDSRKRVAMRAKSAEDAARLCKQFPVELEAELVLSGAFGDSNLATFRGWEKVELIHLSNTLVSSQGLGFLRACPNLQRVELMGAKNFSQEEIHAAMSRIPGCELVDNSSD